MGKAGKISYDSTAGKREVNAVLHAHFTLFAVTPGQSSVRNGVTGSPSRL